MLLLIGNIIYDSLAIIELITDGTATWPMVVFGDWISVCYLRNSIRSYPTPNLYISVGL